ncbi:MAG: hypothetical protein H0W96_05745 [Solirubrobacterales bacterium]|nr:hypothetical protein [Solirubrobacterales bacterium]
MTFARRSTFAVLAAIALVATACGGGAPGVGQAGPTAAVPAAPAATATPDRFFEGKTIRVVVGLEAGGGFDTTARLLARHMGKYIPGNPTLVVENMPGAGSRVAANFLYKVAQPDGLTFGVFNEVQVLQQAQGAAGIEFDATKYSWLGSAFSATIVCLARKDSGFTKIEDTVGASKPFIVGSTGPGSNTGDFPQVLRAALGANIKVVGGYQGTAGISRAVETNEVQGGCWTWETMRVTQGQNIQSGAMIPLVQQGAQKEKDLPNTPLAVDVAKTAEAKAMLKAVTAPGVISKPFAAPPGVPEARLKILQEAFLKAWQDKDLLEEAAKAKIDVGPKDAASVLATVKELLATDKAVLAQLTAALAAK